MTPAPAASPHAPAPDAAPRREREQKDDRPRWDHQLLPARTEDVRRKAVYLTRGAASQKRVQKGFKRGASSAPSSAQRTASAPRSPPVRRHLHGRQRHHRRPARVRRHRRRRRRHSHLAARRGSGARQAVPVDGRPRSWQPRPSASAGESRRPSRRSRPGGDGVHGRLAALGRRRRVASRARAIRKRWRRCARSACPPSRIAERRLPP